MSRILVTDGEQRSALAVVRSAGRRGDEVHVTSPSGRSISGASRHARSDHAVGSSGHLEYPNSIIRYACEIEADLVLAVTEGSLRALLPVADRLPGGGIPMADAEGFARVSDKQTVLEVAAEIGIRVPRQIVLDRPGDLGALADAWPTFPVVMKPSRSVSWPDASGARRSNPGVTYLFGPDELERQVRAWPDDGFPVLIQECVTGQGAGVFLLVDEGELVACFAHRRVREKPPSGGVSVCRKTGPLEEELIHASRALLDRLGWSGVAMVEFKMDPRSGEPVLMEVNGRFWGSLQLAIDAGVDFPRLVLDRAERRPTPPPSFEWRDIRLRWLWGEFDHVLARLRGRGGPPGGSPQPLDGLRSILETLRPSLTDRTEVLRLGDPGPFLRESRDRIVWMVRRAGRLLPSRASGTAGRDARVGDGVVP